MTILPFVQRLGDSMATYVIEAGDDDIVAPLWPGLWELDYPDDQIRNPYWRFGINNGDGEHLAVWRAAAWCVIRQLCVYCIPTYYRDSAAVALGIEPFDIGLVDWEYEIDNEAATFEIADKGFVSARSCVPIRPGPSMFQTNNKSRAGLFALRSFDDLTSVELAVSGDTTSEIVLFGVANDQRRADLMESLRTTERPVLRQVLQHNEVFIDLSIDRERYFSRKSFFAIRSTDPHLPSRLERIVDHYDHAWTRYEMEVSGVGDFDEFGEAIERLLAPPV